jgi:hypothetical protein
VLQQLLGTEIQSAEEKDALAAAETDGVGDEVDFRGLSLRDLADSGQVESRELQFYAPQTVEECMQFHHCSRRALLILQR